MWRCMQKESKEVNVVYKNAPRGSTHLFRIQVPLLITRHMLRKPDRLVPDGDGMLEDVLELVLCVAWTELPGVGVHSEGHDGLISRCE